MKLNGMTILKYDVFKGYEYIIAKSDVCFLAYIKLPNSSKFYNIDYDDIPLLVHGGLTYCGDRLNDDDFWIGWDYGHLGDKPLIDNSSWFFKEKNTRMWTVPEIFQHIMTAIDQLILLENSKLVPFAKQSRLGNENNSRN